LLDEGEEWRKDKYIIGMGKEYGRRDGRQGDESREWVNVQKNGGEGAASINKGRE
jgi:hypothetical protein